MFKDILYMLVEQIAVIHDHILDLNNSFELALSDKQLHFIVIGLLGMAIFLVVNPVFKALARHGKLGTVSWIYTTTLIIVITFSIEIGQKITNTGKMDFADIVFGVLGFFFLHLIYWIVVTIVQAIRRFIRHNRR